MKVLLLGETIFKIMRCMPLHQQLPVPCRMGATILLMFVRIDYLKSEWL